MNPAEYYSERAVAELDKDAKPGSGWGPVKRAQVWATLAQAAAASALLDILERGK